MDEFVGVITKEEYISDDLVKDVLFLIGGKYPLRLGNAGCEFSISNNHNLSELKTVRGMDVDVNIIPKKNREKKIIVADMDSTLINEECIDELAKFTGIADKILPITKKSMNGEISFLNSLVERTSLFKGLNSKALEECFLNCISLSKGAKILISTMNSRSAKSYIISGGYNFFVSKIAEILSVTDYFSNNIMLEGDKFSGKLVKPIIHEMEKLKILKKICKNNNLKLKDVLAVGDGANDMKMLESSGLGVAYKSKKIVKSCTNIHFDFSDLSALLFLQGICETQFLELNHG